MRFSVVIPVYNKANTVTESIESVLKQTESDYEIIVVNDGSSDNTDEILKNYNNIRVINQENGGVSRARNTGINFASGEYICFLDADDVWLPNHLEELYALIKKYPNAGMYVTSHIETTLDGKMLRSGDCLRQFERDFLCNNLFELLNKNSYSIINTNSICIKHELIQSKQLYFAPGEKIGEDTDMWFRVALNAPVAISKEVTTMYRRENSTATRNGSNSFDWIFAKRWEDIKNQSFPVDKISECGKMIDRYKLACCRDYILMNDRTKAIKLLKEVKNCDKRYFVTLLIICVPYFLGRYIITQRRER